MSSLVSTAIRLSALRLLQGATFAGPRVHDSAIAPIDHIVENGSDEPFIIVSTEDEEHVNFPTRDINDGERSLDLVIEVAIAHSMAADDGGGGAIVIPGTDAGFEITLTLITRQILRALFEQRGHAWADMFKRMTPAVHKVTNKRGTGNADGTRFAARQIILTLDVMNEPLFGDTVAPNTLWGDFLALLTADAELAPLEPLFRQTITGTPAIDDWDRARSDQGLLVDAAERIAVTGIIADEAPPLLDDGDMDADTTGVNGPDGIDIRDFGSPPK